MGSPARLLDEACEEIVLAIQNGMSLRELAYVYNIHRSTIGHWARRKGVKSKYGGSCHKKPRSAHPWRQYKQNKRNADAEDKGAKHQKF